jgi:carbonic anhydrase/acetyltransferase-like protein (isoleucine patch superfamily)
LVLVEHRGAVPQVHPAAYVAPTAVLCGDVRVGPHCRVLFGAVLSAGPRAYLTGCTVEDNVFLATGTTVFNGAHIGARSEVRINGVVHLRTRVPPGTTVPIGWIAVGDPARLFPPQQDERLWPVQRELDFPGYVFGLTRAAEGESTMPELTRRYGRALGHHRDDRVLPGEP